MTTMYRCSKRLIVLSILAASLVAGCGGGGGGSDSADGDTAGAPGGSPGGGAGGGGGGGAGSEAAPAKTWTSAKFGGGGYVSGLVFHPTTANLLYARTDIGGAYRRNHATASWVPITDGAGFGGGESRYHGIESIAVDPNNDHLVYVVGVVNGVWFVYRSDDAGATWTRFNDDAHQFGGFGVMAADQNVYGRIYVSGTGRGLLYSN